MTVLITLTVVGADMCSTFDLYSDLDYTSAFDTEVPVATLLGGYSCAIVPDGTTTIRVKPHECDCTDYVDLVLSTTTTTTTVVPTEQLSYLNENTCNCDPEDPDCDPTCIKSFGNILVNGIAQYTWTGGTTLPQSGVLTANIGDTITINGQSYVTGPECSGTYLSYIAIYINAVLVDDAVEGVVFWEFEYTETTVINIVTSCPELT